jgi:hypothetical protein
MRTLFFMYRFKYYREPNSSISNTKVAYGGIKAPAPRWPYAISEGKTTIRFSPGFISETMMSQPGITYPSPTGNSNF